MYRLYYSIAVKYIFPTYIMLWQVWRHLLSSMYDHEPKHITEKDISWVQRANWCQSDIATVFDKTTNYLLSMIRKSHGCKTQYSYWTINDISVIHINTSVSIFADMWWREKHLRCRLLFLLILMSLKQKKRKEKGACCFMKIKHHVQIMVMSVMSAVRSK